MSRFLPLILAIVLALIKAIQRLCIPSSGQENLGKVREVAVPYTHESDNLLLAAYLIKIHSLAVVLYPVIVYCTAGHPCILMEYMEAKDLRTYLRHLNTTANLMSPEFANVLDTWEVLGIGVQAAEGMEYLAARKVITLLCIHTYCLIQICYHLSLSHTQQSTTKLEFFYISNVCDDFISKKLGVVLTVSKFPRL